MLIVTHELASRTDVADRVVFIHEGRIHEDGSARRVLVRPTQPRTREFLRSFTLFSLPADEGPPATTETIGVVARPGEPG